MRVLLMNTAGAEGWVALADTSLNGPVAGCEPLPGRGSSEALMPAVRRLFEAAGWESSGLGAVMVVDGPGSFTGVRVGLSAAKGLCEAVGAGLVAISRLELVAGSSARTTAALLDAGRGEFYCGVYEGGARLRETLVGRERVLELAASGVRLVTCEARVAESLAGQVEVTIFGEPEAGQVLAAGLLRIGAGRWSDVGSTDANYLRRTDAELVFERRLAGGA